MSRTTWMIIGLVSLLGTPLSSLSAAEVSSRASFDSVARVTEVTARNGDGRVQRFKDSGNREFAVKHDAQQRVQAVSATRGPHISDIVSIGYAEDGRPIGVKFRSGYTLFFNHQPTGTVIRDSDGASLVRVGRSLQAEDSGTPAQSEKLASAVSDFESLMASLGQSIR